MFWILLSTSFALSFYFILVKPFTHWSRRGIPQSNIWFFWKRIFKVFVDRKPFAEKVQELYNCYPNERYAAIYQLNMPQILIRDPYLLKQILVKDFDHFVDHRNITLGEPLWDNNLLALKGEKWRRMRTTLSPSFTSSKMKMMFALMNECGKQFVDELSKDDGKIKCLEMKDIFSRYANDIIASVAFGLKCDSLKEPENEFYLKGKAATNFGGIKFLLLFMLPRLSKLFGLKLFSDETERFFGNIIKDTIEYREREGIVRLDMIHLLMQARKGKLKDEHSNTDFSAEEIENYKSLSDEEIISNATIFFLAGFESVSANMAFVAYELAVNPNIQKRLQEEVDETLISSNGSISYDALMKMKYLDMVISESLRKWPTTTITDRMCVKSYIIEPNQPGEKPLYLQVGDVLAIPILAIHRDSRFYPEPDRFDPDRFSKENKSSLNPYTYLTFGIGPRSCIGNRFALLEMKTIFFYILSKFDIVVTDKTTIPLQIGDNPVSLGSKDGFWLGLQLRKNSEI